MVGLSDDSNVHNHLNTAIMLLVSTLLVLTVLFLLEPSVPSQQEEKYTSIVNGLFNEVLHGVEDMRGLPAPEGTQLIIVPIQYFIDNAKKDVQKNQEEVNFKDIIYKSLFLIPQNYSVGEAQVAQANQILAVVDGTKLYIVKENFDPFNIRAAKRTLAHEITHLLQSQFMSPSLTTSDQRWAWVTLVEGDADFTADSYIAKSGLFSYETNVIESLDKINSFPYTYGSGFISVLYKEGGWNLINSAYKNPPRSTEEILHPNVYLEGSAFKNVDSLSPNSSGWNIILTDTFGEYFIQVMLENGVTNNEALVAATGWNGDNITLFNKDNTYLVTWSLTWNTTRDASEFIETFGKMVSQMGGEKVEPGVYHLNRYYVTFSKNGAVTEIASSTDEEPILSIMHMMKP